MDVVLARDIVIIVSGIVVILAAIILIIIALLLYGKTKKILKSAGTTAARMEALGIIATDEIGKPLAQAAGLIQGLTCGLDTFCKIFKKGEEKR